MTQRLFIFPVFEVFRILFR